MGQVQNGRLYIKYRSSSQKNKTEELKKLTDYFPLLWLVNFSILFPVIFLYTILAFDRFQNQDVQVMLCCMLLLPAFVQSMRSLVKNKFLVWAGVSDSYGVSGHE